MAKKKKNVYTIRSLSINYTDGDYTGVFKSDIIAVVQP